MRISAKADYALRVLLLLAEHAPALVKLETLTTEDALPRKFVEAILAELRRAGLVASRRGSDGGYALAVPAAEITVGDVLRVVDGPLTTTPPVPRAPGHPAAARLGQVWAAVDHGVSAVLDATTLEHVLRGDLPEHVARAGRTS